MSPNTLKLTIYCFPMQDDPYDGMSRADLLAIGPTFVTDPRMIDYVYRLVRTPWRGVNYYDSEIRALILPTHSLPEIEIGQYGSVKFGRERYMLRPDSKDAINHLFNRWFDERCHARRRKHGH